MFDFRDREKLRKPSSSAFVQMIRYGISGGVAFLVDFGLMVLLGELFSVSGVLAGTVSFGIGLTVTYVFSIRWIFDKRRFDSRIAEFITFAAIGAVGLLLTWLLMLLQINMFGIHYIPAKIITTVIVTVWNFVAKKFILFSK